MKQTLARSSGKQNRIMHMRIVMCLCEKSCYCFAPVRLCWSLSSIGLNIILTDSFLLFLCPFLMALFHQCCTEHLTEGTIPHLARYHGCRLPYKACKACSYPPSHHIAHASSGICAPTTHRTHNRPPSPPTHTHLQLLLAIAYMVQIIKCSLGIVLLLLELPLQPCQLLLHVLQLLG